MFRCLFYFVKNYLLSSRKSSRRGGGGVPPPLPFFRSHKNLGAIWPPVFMCSPGCDLHRLTEKVANILAKLFDFVDSKLNGWRLSGVRLERLQFIRKCNTTAIPSFRIIHFRKPAHEPGSRNRRLHENQCCQWLIHFFGIDWHTHGSMVCGHCFLLCVEQVIFTIYVVCLVFLPGPENRKINHLFRLCFQYIAELYFWPMSIWTRWVEGYVCYSHVME